MNRAWKVVRFLAVAVLLTVVAYLWFGTQPEDVRRDLLLEIGSLREAVKANTDATAENSEKIDKLLESME